MHLAPGDELATLFDYDGLDRQVMVTDPRGVQTVTGYDLAGRRDGLIENWGGGPLERQTGFAYNPLDQLVTQTATNKTSQGASLAEQVTDFRYDTLGRQTRVVYPDSSEDSDGPTCTDCVEMAYDVAGRMTQRIDQRQQTSVLAHDDRGLLLSRTLT